MNQPSFVVIDQRATELLQRLAPYLVKGNVLPCKIKTTDGPYLYLESELPDPGNPCRGEVLIPHSYVLLVATGEVNRPLGFLPVDM